MNSETKGIAQRIRAALRGEVEHDTQPVHNVRECDITFRRRGSKLINMAYRGPVALMRDVASQLHDVSLELNVSIYVTGQWMRELKSNERLRYMYMPYWAFELQDNGNFIRIQKGKDSPAWEWPFLINQQTIKEDYFNDTRQ